MSKDDYDRSSDIMSTFKVPFTDDDLKPVRNRACLHCTKIIQSQLQLGVICISCIQEGHEARYPLIPCRLCFDKNITSLKV